MRPPSARWRARKVQELAPAAGAQGEEQALNQRVMEDGESLGNEASRKTSGPECNARKIASRSKEGGRAPKAPGTHSGRPKARPRIEEQSNRQRRQEAPAKEESRLCERTLSKGSSNELPEWSNIDGKPTKKEPETGRRRWKMILIENVFHIRIMLSAQLAEA